MYIFFQGTNYELCSFSIYIIPKNFLKVKFFFDIFYIDKTPFKHNVGLEPTTFCSSNKCSTK